MRVLVAGLACLVASVAGLAHAQDGAVPVIAGQPIVPVAQAPAAEAGTVSSRTVTLRQLGMNYEATLRGLESGVGVPFSVRLDELVQGATLHLEYSYSPALLPDLSHLKVTVNGVTVATLPTPRETAGQRLKADVPINPVLVSAYNQLDVQLIGHYSRECEDPDHTSLWANIDTASSLTLDTLLLPLADDLALLPAPFFDPRDTRHLSLPVFFPQHPDMRTVRAAGIVTSWLGALAGYRGAAFPVAIGLLPASGNAVVFATPATLPAALAGQLPSLASTLAGPTIAVAPNPNDHAGKLLLVLGRTPDELVTAATALALRTPMSGTRTLVSRLDEPARRRPYDAPNWVPGTHPVHFRDLLSEGSRLSVSGYHPDVIRLGLRLPPDLFTWRRDGIPMTLKYRYTVPGQENQSALNLSVNDTFVATLPLNGRPYANSLPLQWWNQLSSPRGRMPVEQRLTLPTGAFSPDSQLRFHFFFDRPRAQECKNTFPDVSGAIDADSTIDLSSFHHYMAMPNLAAFANAGYPFTRLADLADTTVVMPDGYNDSDVANVLWAMGRMGAATGYPALRVEVVAAADVGAHADSDLLVFGSRDAQPLLRQWSDRLPLGGDDRARRFSLSDWLLERFPGFLSFDARRTDLPTLADVSVTPGPGDVVLMGFESPLAAHRSVVAVMANQAENVGALAVALDDPDQLKQVQGSLVLLRDGKITSVAGNQTYYVGHLPWPTWLRWYFSQHPLWLALGVVLLCLLLALGARFVLLRHSRARMLSGEGDERP
jgi:hypothetical protein